MAGSAPCATTSNARIRKACTDLRAIPTSRGTGGPDGLPGRSVPPRHRLDTDGALVGPGDVDAQVDAVVRNAITALTAAEATPDRVVRSVIYVAV